MEAPHPPRKKGYSPLESENVNPRISRVGADEAQSDIIYRNRVRLIFMRRNTLRYCALKLPGESTLTAHANPLPDRGRRTGAVEGVEVKSWNPTCQQALAHLGHNIKPECAD